MGSHTITVEADLMRIETHGPFTGAEAERVFQRLAAILRAHGRVYVLIDARGGVSFDSEMRRQVTHMPNITSPTAVAIFGATVAQQAMMILLNSAIQIVRGSRVPIRFSRNETEAQAWLLGQRPAGAP